MLQAVFRTRREVEILCVQVGIGGAVPRDGFDPEKVTERVGEFAGERAVLAAQFAHAQWIVGYAIVAVISA